jgi:hypothetical protein
MILGVGIAQSVLSHPRFDGRGSIPVAGKSYLCSTVSSPAMGPTQSHSRMSTFCPEMKQLTTDLSSVPKSTAVALYLHSTMSLFF